MRVAKHLRFFYYLLAKLIITFLLLWAYNTFKKTYCRFTNYAFMSITAFLLYIYYLITFIIEVTNLISITLFCLLPSTI